MWHACDYTAMVVCAWMTSALSSSTLPTTVGFHGWVSGYSRGHTFTPEQPEVTSLVHYPCFNLVFWQIQLLTCVAEKTLSCPCCRDSGSCWLTALTGVGRQRGASDLLCVYPCQRLNHRGNWVFLNCGGKRKSSFQMLISFFFSHPELHSDDDVTVMCSGFWLWGRSQPPVSPHSLILTGQLRDSSHSLA